MQANIWKISTLVLAGALAWNLAGGTLQAGAEPQPHMRMALEFLQKARNQLEKASADKGGHRVKAIGHIDAAIGEVKAGVQFDNRH
jgi:hypothetical protein